MLGLVLVSVTRLGPGHGRSRSCSIHQQCRSLVSGLLALCHGPCHVLIWHSYSHLPAVPLSCDAQWTPVLGLLTGSRSSSGPQRIAPVSRVVCDRHAATANDEESDSRCLLCIELQEYTQDGDTLAAGRSRPSREGHQIIMAASRPPVTTAKR